LPTDITGHRSTDQRQSHIAVAVDTADLHFIGDEGIAGSGTAAKYGSRRVHGEQLVNIFVGP
jgi:hypothetical protein